MRRIIGCLICLVLGSAVGCSAQSSRTNVVSREQAEELGKVVRAAITEPSLLKLDKGQSVGAGGRSYGPSRIKAKRGCIAYLAQADRVR